MVLILDHAVGQRRQISRFYRPAAEKRGCVNVSHIKAGRAKNIYIHIPLLVTIAFRIDRLPNVEIKRHCAGKDRKIRIGRPLNVR